MDSDMSITGVASGASGISSGVSVLSAVIPFSAGRGSDSPVEISSLPSDISVVSEMGSLLVHSARGGLFHQGSVVHHSIVESEATCKVVGFKAIAHQNTGGDIAAQAALTDHIHRLSGFQLTDAFPQLIHRDVPETVNVATTELTDLAGIQ